MNFQKGKIVLQQFHSQPQMPTYKMIQNEAVNRPKRLKRDSGREERYISENESQKKDIKKSLDFAHVLNGGSKLN